MFAVICTGQVLEIDIPVAVVKRLHWSVYIGVFVRHDALQNTLFSRPTPRDLSVFNASTFLCLCSSHPPYVRTFLNVHFCPSFLVPRFIIILYFLVFHAKALIYVYSKYNRGRKTSNVTNLRVI